MIIELSDCRRHMQRPKKTEKRLETLLKVVDRMQEMSGRRPPVITMSLADCKLFAPAVKAVMKEKGITEKVDLTLNGIPVVKEIPVEELAPLKTLT